VIGNFILGYPAENEDDIRKTIKFAGKLPLYGANFSRFTPHPVRKFSMNSKQKKFHIR